MVSAGLNSASYQTNLHLVDACNNEGSWDEVAATTSSRGGCNTVKSTPADEASLRHFAG